MREDKPHRALEYINGLERGDYIFHLSMLTNIEMTSAIRRRATRNWVGLVSIWKQNVANWERDGLLFMYPPDRDRMDIVVTVAQRERLKGADSVVAALAEELGMPIKTFDAKILDRFPTAST